MNDDKQDRVGRRAFLTTGGSGLAALVTGVGTITAKPPDGPPAISEFDPDVRSELRSASEAYRNVENRGRRRRIWVALSEEQRIALLEANEVDTVTVEEEVTSDPQPETASASLTSSATASASGTSSSTASASTTSSSTGSASQTTRAKEVAVTSTAKNVFGNLLAKFRHEVYWEYNSSAVTYIDPTYEGTTHWPFWTFVGLSSQSQRSRSCTAESRRVGQFNYSVTKYGLIQQKNMGSEINPKCDGTYTRRKIG